jgi:hypothetical protein
MADIALAWAHIWQRQRLQRQQQRLLQFGVVLVH